MGEDDLKITFKKEHLALVKRFFNQDILLLIIFLAALILYVNINGMPLTHPGNIKASDPMGHALISEDIAATRQWNYFNVVYSLNREKEVNPQPPLMYMNSAILYVFSGIPTWVTLYFLVCLSQALYVAVVYLIAKEIFEDKNTALLAAGLTLLPLPVSVWLYGVYIGLWIQVPSYFFMLCFFWLFIRYLKKKEEWPLFFMGLSLSSVMLTHSPDIMLLFFPTLITGISLLIDYLKTKDLKTMIKKGLLFAAIPFLVFLVLSPRYLIVWRWHSGGKLYTPGFYGYQNVHAPVDPVARLVFPEFRLFPALIFIIFITGLIFLAVNSLWPYSLKLKKEKGKMSLAGKRAEFKARKFWLLFTIYYFAFVYLAELFLYSPTYIGRMRALQPYIVYPTVAFAICSIIEIIIGIVGAYSINERKNSEKNYSFIKSISLVLAILIALTFGGGLQQYSQLKESVKYEHIHLEQYQAYEWLHKNSKMTDFVLFIGNLGQGEGQYIKRTHSLVSVSDNSYQEAVQYYIENNRTPTQFKGSWGGSTARTNIQEISFWKYIRSDEPSGNRSIYFFDYIIFQDFSQESAAFNRQLIQDYVTNNNFRLVYDKAGYAILKNENEKPQSRL